MGSNLRGRPFTPYERWCTSIQNNSTGLYKTITVSATNHKHSAAVIFLHGEGDCAPNFASRVMNCYNIQSPYIKFYFMNAPYRSDNSLIPLDPQKDLGIVGPLPRWFLRLGLKQDSPEDKNSLDNMGELIESYVQKVVSDGTPRNRIIIGGFSMGGAAAIYSAYHYVPGLAGVFGISTFLKKKSFLYSEMCTIKPKLLMIHSDEDKTVPITWAKDTFIALDEVKARGMFRTLESDGMHDVCRNYLITLVEWLKKYIPPTKGDVSEMNKIKMYNGFDEFNDSDDEEEVNTILDKVEMRKSPPDEDYIPSHRKHLHILPRPLGTINVGNIIMRIKRVVEIDSSLWKAVEKDDGSESSSIWKGISLDMLTSKPTNPADLVLAAVSSSPTEHVASVNLDIPVGSKSSPRQKTSPRIGKRRTKSPNEADDEEEEEEAVKDAKRFKSA